MSTMKSEKSESIESEILFTDMIWINTAHSFSYLIKYFFFHKPFFFFFLKRFSENREHFCCWISFTLKIKGMESLSSNTWDFTNL